MPHIFTEDNITNGGHRKYLEQKWLTMEVSLQRMSLSSVRTFGAVYYIATKYIAPLIYFRLEHSVYITKSDFSTPGDISDVRCAICSSF